MSAKTHLSPDQEYSFQLHAQSYDFYYSHGTTNSADICIAVKCGSFLSVAHCNVVQGHLVALELQSLTSTFRVVGVYAPSLPAAHKSFFKEMQNYFTNNMLLLGDFNSVTSEMDHFSRNLDPTSTDLHSLLDH